MELAKIIMLVYEKDLLMARFMSFIFRFVFQAPLKISILIW